MAKKGWRFVFVQIIINKKAWAKFLNTNREPSWPIHSTLRSSWWWEYTTRRCLRRWRRRWWQRLKQQHHRIQPRWRGAVPGSTTNSNFLFITFSIIVFLAATARSLNWRGWVCCPRRATYSVRDVEKLLIFVWIFCYSVFAPVVPAPLAWAWLDCSTPQRFTIKNGSQKPGPRSTQPSPVAR